MLYRFKSRATADLVMVQAQGDRLLQLLGREPSAQGIFTVEQLPGAIARLEAAIAEEAAARHTTDADPSAGEEPGEADRDPVGLAQRAWPLLQAMREASRSGVDLVWGV